MTTLPQHHASRYRSDQGAVFSSSKCPPGAGQTCGLPFGFVWTPLAPSSPSSVSSVPTVPLSTTSSTLLLPQETTPAELPAGSICITCLAYINLYCEVNLSTGKWTCALCRSENIVATSTHGEGQGDVDTAGSSSGAVIHADSDVLSRYDVEFRQALDGRRQSDVVTTFTTTTSPTPTIPVTTTQRIILVVDQNLPVAEALAVGSVVQQYSVIAATQGYDIEWGLIVFGSTVQIYHVGSDVASGMAAADIIYRSSSSSHYSHLGLASFSSSPPLSENENPGDAGITESRFSHDENDLVYLGRSVDTLLTCLSASFGTVSTTRSSSNTNDTLSPSHLQITGNETEPLGGGEPVKKSRLDILKERKQARLLQQEVVETLESKNLASSSLTSKNPPKSPWLLARERAAASAPPLRCTGKAIQCAMDLMSVVTVSSITTDSAAPSESGATGRRHDRILLFTNGCPNAGDGSVVDLRGNGGKSTLGMAAYSTVDPGKLARASEFFDVIAKASATDAGIGIDVFCTGASELGLPAYQSLVEPSAGYVLLHDSFSTPHLFHNMQYVLLQTRLVLAQYVLEEEDVNTDSDKQVPPQTSPAPIRTWMDTCTVDIRMSSFLDPSHLIGPGDLVASADGPMANEEICFAQGVKLAEQFLKFPKKKVVPSLEMLESTLTRIRLGRFDPLSTFSVMLSLNDFFQHDEFAIFQCIVRYVDRNGQLLVTRVSTHRLSVASTVGEFLEAIDEEVVPVLLGKEAVYRSMFGLEADVEHPFQAPHAGQLDSLAYDAQRDLDNTVFQISGAFRLLSLEKGTRTIDLTEEGGIKAAGSSMDFAFPPELSDALRRMYHLRRGPFLSPGPLQSIDDRAEMRSLFVRFPLEDCLHMMAPSLWSSGDIDDAVERNCPSMENVPPETLALWENRIIAADHSHSLFVWSGSSTLDPKYDLIRGQMKNFLLERSQRRFPMPNLHLLTEMDSMSRRFISLLGPSHGDPVEHQLVHFQALTQLTLEEQTKLHGRFRFYAPDTDPSFRNWFWDVASAASGSGQEGMSLCD